MGHQLFSNKPFSKQLIDSVIIPGLFTKFVGRILMLTHAVSPMSTPLAFLGTSLLYGVPVIFLTACLIRGLWAYYAQDDNKEIAALKSLKCAIKFSVVYLAWTAAAALASSLGLLSGGLLPLGMVLVAGIVGLVFRLVQSLEDAKCFKDVQYSTKDRQPLYKYALVGSCEGLTWTAWEALPHAMSAIADALCLDLVIAGGVLFTGLLFDQVNSNLAAACTP